MIKEVVLSKRAQKEIRRLPRYIVESLASWIEAVENDGLEIVRKLPGYHDEPLLGKRRGQRSIRLSRHYRAIYVIKSNFDIKFILIEEVNRHDC